MHQTFKLQLIHIMQFIKLGYVYKFEQDAQSARKKAADYYGLPISIKDETTYFVNYLYSEIDNFWYIIWCEGCTEVLGNPYEFIVNYPENKSINE